MTVKGVNEPVAVYEVTGLGPLRTRFQRATVRGLTKFVGREREMETLRHVAELARSGHGQVATAIGEPGAGKSRLFHEFKLISQSDWMTLAGFSVSHGKATAYLPVLELLREYFRITATDDLRSRREKVIGRVLALDRGLEDTLPFLLALLGVSEGDVRLAQMDAQVRRRRTHEAIKRILLRESLNQPLMVVLEDLHWIDSETQALLNLLVDAVGNARLLLLVNYRPEYRHEWGNRTYYTQLRLDPLGREGAGQMLEYLLGTEQALAALKQFIIARTEGNPFFMEEIVQALFDEGALVRNGQVRLIKPLGDLRIPLTVQAMLAARIDRLPAAEKELLQTLSVIGKEPALELIRRVTGKEVEQLDPLLKNLQLGEFIYEQPSFAGAEYTFKHALTQEVTYNSLLVERRRTVHEKTGNAIEAFFSQRLEDHYAELARHFLRSEDAAKAIRYAQLAADQALNRASLSEANDLIDASFRLLDRLPEGTERLRAEFGLRRIENARAFALSGGSQERERAVTRMCELGERIGEKQALLLGLTERCHLHFFRGEASAGLELARRCLKLAEETHDPESLAVAGHYVALLAHSCGNLQQAVSQHRNDLRYGVQANIHVLQIGLLYKTLVASTLARDLHLLGRVGEALIEAEQGLRYARESKHPFSLCFALCVPNVRYYRREPENHSRSS